MVLKLFLAKSEALHSGSNKNLTLWTEKEFVSIFKTKPTTTLEKKTNLLKAGKKINILNLLILQSEHLKNLKNEYMTPIPLFDLFPMQMLSSEEIKNESSPLDNIDFPDNTDLILSLDSKSIALMTKTENVGIG
jgi:hypothetical protein